MDMRASVVATISIDPDSDAEPPQWFNDMGSDLADQAIAWFAR
jgi:hypothetical protein